VYGTCPVSAELTKGVPVTVLALLPLLPYLLPLTTLLARLSPELMRWLLVAVVLYGSGRRAVRALHALAALSGRIHR